MVRKDQCVLAAEVAAELNRGVLFAKRLKLVASNARALALRAGKSAAGFKPVTDSIDDLVTLTLTTSNNINRKAQALSQLATSKTRALTVIEQFDLVYRFAANATHISSLDQARLQSQTEFLHLDQQFNNHAKILRGLLEELNSHLRIAQIISTMLSVEASQVEEKFRHQLNAIADSVTQFANAIRHHVVLSLSLFTLF